MLAVTSRVDVLSTLSTLSAIAHLVLSNLQMAQFKQRAEVNRLCVLLHFKVKPRLISVKQNIQERIIKELASYHIAYHFIQKLQDFDVLLLHLHNMHSVSVSLTFS